VLNPTEYRASVILAADAADAYYNTDVEKIDDPAYDAILERIRDYEAANPADVIEHALFTAVAAGTSEGGDVVHSRPMLSLDKANTDAEVEAFLAKAAELGAYVNVEPKLDGLAVNLVYIDGKLVQAATRGDGATGEDVTSRLSAITVGTLPHDIGVAGRTEVRGELIMTDSDFEYSNAARVASGKPAFANPRNATAGTLRRQTIDYDARLTFIAYDAIAEQAPAGIGSHSEMTYWLGQLGFDPATDLMGPPDARRATLEYIARFGRDRKSDAFPYPTDGIVLNIDEYDIRDQLGATSRAPRWAIAFKYEAEVGVTVLRSIDMAVGRTGNISFTANVDPVLVDGSTISRATLHNFDFIRENDLQIGDTVEIYKANDIIPRIVRSFPELRPADSVVYDPERVCPISGEPLDTSGVIWRSTAPEASLGALIKYATSRDALDIEGVGEEVADALVESGLVNDLADLFALTLAQLTTLQLADTKTGTRRQFGAKNASKLVAEIEKAKSQPVNRLITALGIRKSGRTFGRRLAAGFHTIDALLETTEEGFLASGVEGVGPERARLFYEGFQRLRPVLEKLRAAGVNFGEQPAATDGDDSQSDSLPLAGMKVVVTGAMTGPLSSLNRNEVTELIEASGGQASGSVSKATSLLVCGEEGSSKFVKAQALGVKIVTPEQFAAMLGRADA
jgi:DNA ligase (NAD+)